MLSRSMPTGAIKCPVGQRGRRPAALLLRGTDGETMSDSLFTCCRANRTPASVMDKTVRDDIEQQKVATTTEQIKRRQASSLMPENSLPIDDDQQTALSDPQQLQAVA